MTASPPPTSPLPPDLVARYRTWRDTRFQPQAESYATLAKAQSPQALVISCCDSRVNATQLFAASDGDFFIHRNIANLVPPYADGEAHHGTVSAIEYAVCALKVPRILVIGHAGCGGIAAAHAACQSQQGRDDLAAKLPFVSQWIGQIAPAFSALPPSLQKDASRDALTQLEQTSIIHSLKNLAEFWFVAEAMTSRQLQLCGLWHDIGRGRLYAYDGTRQKFQAV